ncbi:MAG: aminotransferase class V-fold PLP-dependent enzyme [Planctomycetota bacterium]|nr:aminotransferase class V-fold PLP-dependent enzyme [Planctomycetota bacterium]
MAEPPIYLDYHATTPVDPRVLKEMLPFFEADFGNAASRHAYGWRAEEAVQVARKRVAALIGAEAREIVFTSGATESDNLAIKGVFEACGGAGTHIVSARTEHSAVLDSLAEVEARGAQVTWVPVGPDGRVRIEDVEAALTEQTVLITLMAANNEVGTLHRVRKIGQLAEARGILFHTDAAQAVGRVPFDVRKDHVHLASLTAHKFYGPKGCGALYVRRRDPEVKITIQMHGGGHERGMRSGTSNVPGIVGLGMACELCRQEPGQEAERTARLRDRLEGALLERLDGVHVNGCREARLPGNLNVCFDGVDGESLLLALPDLALSTGSACHSDKVDPSHVLQAMGISRQLALAALRFGIGRPTTEAEVDRAADRVVEAVQALRTGR